MSFEEWFRKTFASQVPLELAEYVVEHPSGMENGYGPKLWKADWIQGETEDRGLVEKGVCMIGACDSIRHILLRARDGKVIIVDSRDHTMVDAWFSDINLLIGLLKLE